MVSNTFTKTATNTIDDFLQKIKDTFYGTVDASIDSNTGSLVLNDKIDGTSKLSITSLSADTAQFYYSITTVGKEGNGVLSTGKDAFLSVENINMSSSSNSVTGTLTGVTFELKNTSVEKPITVTLQRDSDAIQKKFQEFIDGYNELLKYSKAATTYKDPNDKNSTNGELAGDSTLTSIVSQIRSQIKQEFGLFGTSGKYTNLTMFGLKDRLTEW